MKVVVDHPRQNKKPKITEMTGYDLMKFGKYKGKPLNGIPGDYLEWVLDNVKNIDKNLYAYLTKNSTKIREASFVIRKERFEEMTDGEVCVPH